MVKLQGCVVKELETCNDQTPANIAEALFNFVIKVTPCEKLLGTSYQITINKLLSREPPSSSTMIKSSILLLLIISSVLRIV